MTDRFVLLNNGQRLAWLEEENDFPDVAHSLPAYTGLGGLLAASTSLSAAQLLRAYSHGIFPWYSDGQPVLWWSPDPRMVLYLSEFRTRRSLRQSLARARTQSCVVRLNTAFERVMRHCATAPRVGQHGTWITDTMIEHYVTLHRQGVAHSFELWRDDELLGGGYGLAIGRMFYGESMFARAANASKIALASLVNFLSEQQFRLIDCQQNTLHLASLGAREVTRAQFLHDMRTQTALPALERWPTTLSLP